MKIFPFIDLFPLKYYFLIKMNVALLFNVECQLLTLKKCLQENNREQDVDLDSLILLEQILYDIGKITNVIVRLLSKFQKAHSKEDFQEYKNKVYQSSVTYDMGQYYTLIDNINENILNEYNLRYKIVV